MDTASKNRYFRFLSTLSLRRATATVGLNLVGQIFLSTLSLRRATTMPDLGKGNIRISIHALLAESDTQPCYKCPDRCQFLSTLSLRRATLLLRRAARVPWISIHALLAESDSRARRGSALSANFYPRSPCGERRPRQIPGRQMALDFYPRSPCGERLVVDGHTVHITNFYPRSPCGERRAGRGHVASRH